MIVSLSFAKKAIRAASLDEWQRDTPREALVINQRFFPRVKEAYGSSRVKYDASLAQTLTGHGGFPSIYIDSSWQSPYCACAPDKTQDCCTFRRMSDLRPSAETEVGIGVQILRENFPTS
ncbi:hypothetical protein EVAR_53189_1 [Eumeta japonica]|uniref:Uncharacterized protein n=1 Tax=Eumeta variegata TaxID=151549 RepID=A0A4C1YZK9_EUMVA|nr:hypothetical protein EVAR_53189_1 [Eumeta japonica]